MYHVEIKQCCPIVLETRTCWSHVKHYCSICLLFCTLLHLKIDMILFPPVIYSGSLSILICSNHVTATNRVADIGSFIMLSNG